MNAPSSPNQSAHRSGRRVLNQVRAQDRAVHDWYRFILSFPPHLVQTYIARFKLDDRHCLLDPFCGTGTTVVEGKKLGIPSVGIEANPMACFAGSVKQDWSPNPQRLVEVAARIGAAAQVQIAQQSQPLRGLPDDSQKVLLKNSISPLPLHKTLILLECIQQHAQPGEIRHLKLALAKAVVTSIGNLRFAPEVGIGKPKVDTPVIASWLHEVRTMANDLEQVQPLAGAESIIHQADARHLPQVLAPNSIDAVITSPPYPNEKDYTRTTRLESVLLGFITNKQDLRRLKENLMRSNTRNVYSADRDDRWVAKHPDIQRIAQAIEERRATLNKTSGFSRLYSRAVTLYFGGMAKHLADLRGVLRPGAQLAYVVGDQKSYLQVMIRTGELLGDIAQALGYERVGTDLFRTRLSSKTQEQMREEVVLLRWPGKPPVQAYPFGDDPL